jgi:hypothetical protein
VALVWLLIFFLFNLYQPHSIKPTIPNLKTIGVASLVSLAGSVILFYTIPAFGITPKTNLVIFGIVFIILFIGWRRAFFGIFAKNFRKRVAFIVDTGDRERAAELVKYMENYPQSGFMVAGIYGSPKEFFNGGNDRTDTLIISKNALGGENLKKVYNSAGSILSLSQAYEDILGKVPVDSIDETWFLHNLRNTGNVAYDFAAKIVNFIVALILLAATVPIIVVDGKGRPPDHQSRQSAPPAAY